MVLSVLNLNPKQGVRCEESDDRIQNARMASYRSQQYGRRAFDIRGTEL